MKIFRTIRIAKIKDFILKELKDTIIGDMVLNKKKEDFDKKIQKKYKNEKTQLIIQTLIDSGYIRQWTPSFEYGEAYAIEDKGKLKIEEGGFCMEELKIAFLWPFIVSFIITIIGVILAIFT